MSVPASLFHQLVCDLKLYVSGLTHSGSTTNSGFINSGSQLGKIGLLYLLLAYLHVHDTILGISLTLGAMSGLSTVVWVRSSLRFRC